MGKYSLWVLEYAYIPNLPIAVQFHGAFNEGTRKCPFSYVLIKGEGRVAMVDVGLNAETHGKAMAEQFGVRNWRRARTVLGECGVRPEDVTDVFLTHAHFDHMGAIDDFPNATFYIQERELSKWVWAMSLDRKFRWLMGATDPGDILRIIDVAREGRLRVVDGCVEDVLPGIDLHPAMDTHTFGSMFVSIRNDGAKQSNDGYIFAGDLVYCFENIYGRDRNDPNYIPIGLAGGNMCEILLATDRMAGIVNSELRRIVPIHEDKLGEAFPSRMTKEGLRIFEIALAGGERSVVGDNG